MLYMNYRHFRYQKGIVSLALLFNGKCFYTFSIPFMELIHNYMNSD